jgi:hypothetical protein
MAEIAVVNRHIIRGRDQAASTPPVMVEVKHHFGTLQRTQLARQPLSNASQYPQLHSLVLPHLESFNNLADHIDEGGSLLDHAIRDIGSRSVFDGNAAQNDGLGNKLTVWIEGLHISKPMVPEKAKALKRLTFPTEVRTSVFQPWVSRPLLRNFFSDKSMSLLGFPICICGFQTLKPS